MPTLEDSGLNSFTWGGQFLRNFAVMAKQNVLQTLVSDMLVSGFVCGVEWRRNPDEQNKL